MTSFGIPFMNSPKTFLIQTAFPFSPATLAFNEEKTSKAFGLIKIRGLSEDLGFAGQTKQYKKDPGAL
jgi:hypothetical protein